MTGRVWGLSETLDHREIRIGAFAAHLDLDPLPGPAALGIDKAVIGRGVETPARIEEPDARGKEENARAEIAAKQQLVDRHGLGRGANPPARSEEHTSALQSLMRISYAVFCLK